MSIITKAIFDFNDCDTYCQDYHSELFFYIHIYYIKKIYMDYFNFRNIYKTN